MFANFYDKQAPEDGADAPSQKSPSSKSKKRRRRRKAHDIPTETLSSPDAGNVASVNVERKSADPVPQSQSKRSRGQPSQEALTLSTKLKEYSSQKRVNEALNLYWHESNDSIRDGHHACIVIDCCARCGCIEVRAKR